MDNYTFNGTTYRFKTSWTDTWGIMNEYKTLLHNADSLENIHEAKAQKIAEEDLKYLKKAEGKIILADRLIGNLEKKGYELINSNANHIIFTKTVEGRNVKLKMHYEDWMVRGERQGRLRVDGYEISKW